MDEEGYLLTDDGPSSHKRDYEDDDLIMMKHCVALIAHLLDGHQRSTLETLCHDPSVKPAVFYDLVREYIGQGHFHECMKSLKKAHPNKKQRLNKVSRPKSMGGSSSKDQAKKLRGGGGDSGGLYFRDQMFKKKWLLPREFIAQKQTSIAWDYFYKMGRNHPKFGADDSKGRPYNYQCGVVMDERTGQICGAMYHFPETLFVKKYGAPKVHGGVTHDANSGLKHLQRFHKLSTLLPADEQTPHAETVFSEKVKKLQNMKSAENSAKMQKVKSQRLKKKEVIQFRKEKMFATTKPKGKELDSKTLNETCARMEWYTYSDTLISSESFNDYHTLKMLRSVKKNFSPVFVSSYKGWIQNEWQLFCAFMKKDIEDLQSFHAGNKFGQPLYFSTKESGYTVLTTGIHFVRRTPVVANVNLALYNIMNGGSSITTKRVPNVDLLDQSMVTEAAKEGFKKIPIMKDTDIETILDPVFDADNHVNLNTDVSANDRPTAYALGMLSKESCLTGGLEDDHNFTEAQELFSKLSLWAMEMDSSGDKPGAFGKLCAILKEMKFPLIKPQHLEDESDFTNTQASSHRLKSIYNLMLFMCKTSPAFVKYVDKYSQKRGEQTEEQEQTEDQREKESKECERIEGLRIDEEDIKSLYEIEAVMFVCETLARFCPSENRLSAGFNLVLKRRIETDLNPAKAKLKVIDEQYLAYESTVHDPRTAKMMKRKSACYEECTPLGKKCWDRAYEIYKDMYIGEDTPRDIVATMLDLRTKDCGLLNVAEMKEGIALLEDVFIKYYMNKQKYVQKKASTNSETNGDQQGQEGSNWDSLLEDSGYVENEPDEGKTRQNARAAFKSAISKWLKLKLNWRQEFPNLPNHTPPPIRNDNEETPFAAQDSSVKVSKVQLDDLADADIASLYKRLLSSPNNPYGELPEIALTYIGSYNVESFNQRCELAVKLIMKKGASVLNKEELNKVICLRVNGDYMEFMKNTYPEIVQSIRSKMYVS